MRCFLPGPPARATLDASAFSFGHVHAHDAGAVENDAAAAGDDALHRLTRLGMLRKRFVFHLLHDLKALGFLAFFLGNGLVNVCGHSVCVGKIVRPACVGRKAGPMWAKWNGLARWIVLGIVTGPLALNDAAVMAG